MLLSKFVNALKPKIHKVDILADIQAQQKELTEVVIPNYKEFTSVFSNYQVKSPFLQKVEKGLKKRTGFNKGNLFVEIESRLVQLNTILAKMEDQIDKHFSETVLKEALTLVQANLVQYISASSYAIRYARNLLTLGLIEEAEASGQNSNIRLVKVEHTRLEAEYVHFINTIVNVTDKGKTADQTLSKIPAVFATEEALASLHANRDYVDPFSLNLLDSKFNPAYFIGMVVAERQAANYLDAREDFEIQQSLLLNLKLAQAKQNDPRLEQKIVRQIDRVQKIRKNLDEMEKRYGLKD